MRRHLQAQTQDHYKDTTWILNLRDIVQFWVPEFMTIIVTWQSGATLDSIQNSCNVWTILPQTVRTVDTLTLKHREWVMSNDRGKSPEGLTRAHGVPLLCNKSTLLFSIRQDQDNNNNWMDEFEESKYNHNYLSSWHAPPRVRGERERLFGS